MIEERDYSKDEKIDRYDLPRELARQPKLYKYWADKYADARAVRVKAEEILKLERSDANAELEKVKSELILEIKSDPEEYGLGSKPNKDQIEARAITDDRYIKAREETKEKIVKLIKDYSNAIRNKESFYGARQGMEHKRQALSELSYLLIKEVYSEVPLPKEGKRIVDKERGRKQRKKLNR